MRWNNANGGTQTGIAEQRRCRLTTYGYNLGLSLHNARGNRPEVRAADLLHTSKEGDSIRFDVLGGEAGQVGGVPTSTRRVGYLEKNVRGIADGRQ